MAMSKLVSENEENLKNALSSGISGEAIEKTLNVMLNNAENKKMTPVQVKNAVETIANMKDNVENIMDDSFESELLKQNSEKIKNALKNGISAEEIAKNIIKENDNQKLRFTAHFVSKIKEIELKLTKEKAKQNQLVKNN